MPEITYVSAMPIECHGVWGAVGCCGNVGKVVRKQMTIPYSWEPLHTGCRESAHSHAGLLKFTEHCLGKRQKSAK